MENPTQEAPLPQIHQVMASFSDLARQYNAYVEITRDVIIDSEKSRKKDVSLVVQLTGRLNSANTELRHIKFELAKKDSELEAAQNVIRKLSQFMASLADSEVAVKCGKVLARAAEMEAWGEGQGIVEPVSKRRKGMVSPVIPLPPTLPDMKLFNSVSVISP
jgi:hypothetical protein